MGAWRLKFCCRDRGPDNEEPGADWKTVASTDARWEYRSATIDLNLEQVHRMDDDELEEVVVHELLHVILHQVTDKRMGPEERGRQEEFLCTQLARLFLAFRGQCQAWGARREREKRGRRTKARSRGIIE